MIVRIALASQLIGGCVAAPVEADVNEDVPVYGEGRCDAKPAQSLIGRDASSALGAEALKLSGAETIRWIQPGQVVTMEYRTDRLNIELDAQNKVKAIRCG